MNKHNSKNPNYSSYLMENYEQMLHTMNLRLDKFGCKYPGIEKYKHNSFVIESDGKDDDTPLKKHVFKSGLGYKSDDSAINDMPSGWNYLKSLVENDKTSDESSDTEIEEISEETKSNQSIDFTVFIRDLHTRLKDKFQALKCQACTAYKSKKIFMIYGQFNAVRSVLLMRGWLEKYTFALENEFKGCKLEEILNLAAKGNKYEAVFLSKLMLGYPAYLVWQTKSHQDFFKKWYPYRNIIRRSVRLDFTSKIGLVKCAERVLHNRSDGKCVLNFPRFYRLSGDFDESEKFIKDFYSTQCRNFIRFLVRYERYYAQIIDEHKGSIPEATLLFALQSLENQFLEYDYRLIDEMGTIRTKKMHLEWKEFIERTNKVLHKKAKIKINLDTFRSYVQRGRLTLEVLDEKNPQFKWEGIYNVWILKPAYANCGLGIVVTRDVDEALQLAKKNCVKQYIAQKYIERPLLIYKTKFDIRAYMLISLHSSGVFIWMYHECYLRLCSNKYTISDLRERVHLTNNAVQKNFGNATNRDTRLPSNNMWSLEEFKNYIEQISGSDTIYNSIILPGFVNNLVTVATAYLNDIIYTKNSFELYGCDFMIDESFQPILIEINSSPALTASTSVTKVLCPIVLNDVIKVIVDFSKNPYTKTGKFQLVFAVKNIDTFALTSFRDTSYSRGPKFSLIRNERLATSKEEKNKSSNIKKKIVHNQVKKPVKIVQKIFTSSNKKATANNPEIDIQKFEKLLFSELKMKPNVIEELNASEAKNQLKSFTATSAFKPNLRGKPARQIKKNK